MSSHGGHSHTDGGLDYLPAVTLATANELSWMLGERLIDDDNTTVLAEWVKADARQSDTIFKATAETALVRYESPVGREHYIGTTLTDAERARADLDAAAEWSRAGK
jgi:hypothetical protein